MPKHKREPMTGMKRDQQARNEDGVEQAIANMSLREKIAQTAVEHVEKVVDFSSWQDEEAIRKYLAENPLGGIFIGGEIIKQACGSMEEYQEITALLQKHSPVPLLVVGDLESGAGGAVRSLTRFPPMMALGAVNDPQLAYEMGKYTALEGRSSGFNWSFSPVVDLSLNWLNPIVGRRSLGDCPDRVVELAGAVIRGMQDHGMAACAKHFPGDGVDFRDQHICTSVNDLPEAQWRQTFGHIYRSLILGGVNSIMIGHIGLPWLELFHEGKNRHCPATASSRIVTDLLRKELGFTGVIVSDALNMGGYVGWDSYERRIVDSFNSGMDVMLWPGPKYMDVMLKAVEEGRVTEQRLSDSVSRILRMKHGLGLVRQSDGRADEAGEAPVHIAAAEEVRREARELSKELARRSPTLARNRKRVLPLDRNKVKRILAVSLSHGSIDVCMPAWTEQFRSRGAELTVIENFLPWEKLTYIREREEEGVRWDACLVFYHDRAVNHARPSGSLAKGLWALQGAETIQPIFISMTTPFLLYDVPYADTLVNMYSDTDDLVEMTVKALYGEIPFNEQSPVKLGGWQS